MNDTKICPNCGQEVKAIAKKCRYCGTWFNDTQSQGQQQNESHQNTYHADTELTFGSALSEGTDLGLKNIMKLIVASLLWFVTAWIPYLNVGTTIAMASLPVKLARNEEDNFSGTFIFDEKYRTFMGEFFTLAGLKWMSLVPAYLFGIIPGIVISLGWQQALYLILDKGMSPSEALIQSARISDGYKFTIFFVGLIQSLVFFFILWIGFILLGVNLLPLFVIIAGVCYSVARIGSNAIIYRHLSKRL